MKRVYGYCRVSTPRQNIERQRRNITAAFPDAVLYCEAYTGTTLARPEFERLLRAVRPGDTVVFDSVSRMSRNAAEGAELYEHLFADGIELVFLREPYVNTATYREALAGRIEMTGTDVDCILDGVNRYFMLLARRQIEIAFGQSEKEVSDLRKRTAEGIETARRAGKCIGRPGGKRYETEKGRTCKSLIKRASADFCGSLSDADVIALCRGRVGTLGRGTYYRYKRELKEEIDDEKR